MPSSLQGTYYILASDSSSSTASGAEFTLPAEVTVTSLIKPSLAATVAQPTTTGKVAGSGWDPLSTLSLYLSGPPGYPLLNTFLISVIVNSGGGIPAGTTFIVPDVAARGMSLSPRKRRPHHPTME
ncbi:MAG: hypothetical protein QXU18_13515 [Thermoplasmatales archaeon]